MNDVVTKMTKNVSDLASKTPKISMPKLTVSQSPIITMGNPGSISKAVESSTPTPSIMKTPKSLGIMDQKLFGFSLVNIVLVLAVILILAILGVNIFMYLSEGTDIMSNILQNIASLLPESIAKTFRLSAIGTEASGEFAADTLDDVSKVVGGGEGNAGRRISKMGKGKSAEDLEKELEEEREKNKRKERERINKQRDRDIKVREIALKQENEDRLKSAVENRNSDEITEYVNYSPESSKELGKKGKGWCYIGTDRGFRSCQKVGESDTCMSGKIFRTKGDCETKF
jgi:Tfp pilus assembly protein FimT